MSEYVFYIEFWAEGYWESDHTYPTRKSAKHGLREMKKIYNRAGMQIKKSGVIKAEQARFQEES